MNKKRDYTREKMMRRVDAKKKRIERLVSGYVYHKHPGIYREALKFHDELNALHPQKKDLRKTQQYLAFVRTCKENEKTKSVKDSFTLEIPLMKLTPTKVIEETPVLSTVIEETSVLSTAIEETPVLSTVIEETSVLSTAIEETPVLSTVIEETSVLSTAIEETSVLQPQPTDATPLQMQYYNKLLTT